MNWHYLILAYASLFSIGLIDNARGPALPEILRQFQLTPTQGGYFFAIASFAGLCNNILGRWWLIKLGPKRGMLLFILLTALGSLCLGFCNTDGGGFPFLLLSALILGLGMSGVSVCMNVMVQEGSSPLHLRRAFSGLHAMYGMSSLITPLGLALVLHYNGSWKNYFQILALFPIIIGLLCLRPTPAPLAVQKTTVLDRSLLPPFKTRLRFGLIFGFYVAAEVSLSTWLVYFAESVWHWPLNQASSYLSAFFACLLLGRAGFALFRFRGKTFYWLVAPLCLSILCFSLGLLHHPAWLSLCGLSMSVFWPLALEWMGQKFPSCAGAMITSILTTSGVMLISAHWLIGFLSTNIGIGQALWFGPVFLTISLLFLLQQD